MPSPNLLFLFTDQQRADTLACYGNEQIKMPNLNRLAESSTVFDRAYVTQPVCTPSRSSLLTGLYPHTNNCVGNDVRLVPEIPCLPEMVKRQVYSTGYHGKWHLGDDVFAQHGFDNWISTQDLFRKSYSAGRDQAARSTYHHWLVSQGVHPRDGSVFSLAEMAALPEELSEPAFLAAHASRFIRENSGRPFILYVNFFAPHGPYHSALDSLYDLDEIPLPPSFENPPSADQPLKARLYSERFRAAGHADLPLNTQADWRRLIANYWGQCSLVDKYAGKILDTLSSCGLDEDTIVVFTSDHGDMMGSHHSLTKCVMFEEAVRVPLLVRAPSQTTQRRVTGAVSHIDLVPTLLDMMGERVPEALEGKSLADSLSGVGVELQDDVFIEWNDPGGQAANYFFSALPIDDYVKACGSREMLMRLIADPVRTIVTPDGWKFNCSPEGEHELYNLNDDPYELNNLARDPEQASFMRDLRQESPDGSGERRIPSICRRSKHWDRMKTASYVDLLKSGELEERASLAVERLKNCALCPRHCGVDRTVGEHGRCLTGRKARVASSGPHFGEEAPLVGRMGSGTIFFSSCNLLCSFCQNFDISHMNIGVEVEARQVSGMILDLARQGCHNINFVTPSHIVPQILEAVLVAADAGLDIPLVYNSGGYDSVETLRLLDGVFDIYMPDFKFWDNRWAERFCGVKDYRERATAAILEMHRQVGDLELDDDGVAVRGLLVRHLVMPNGIAGTAEVASFLASEVSPRTYTNIMAQYRPCGNAVRDETIGRSLRGEEFAEAVDAARRNSLTRLGR